MRIMINLFLLSIITISAFGVIFIKHQNRNMNISIEKIDKKLAYELNEHKKLLDDKNKLIHNRLINIDFEKQLGMEMPHKKKIIYLNLVE
tara:strand:+ start:769 stop:1038 length:270 start_codon:yes stop_codon:yes gene_type:complete